MNSERAERIFCSLWHLGLAAMGLVEFNQHKSRTMRVLAAGFVAFHLDATVNDWRGTETYFKRGLRRGVRAVSLLKSAERYEGNS